jgi:hypothetical protein
VVALLADAPALPLHEAGKYVAGAYVVLFALVLIYVAIMAIRVSRIEREMGELLELAERDGLDGAAQRGPAGAVADAGDEPAGARATPESTVV